MLQFSPEVLFSGMIRSTFREVREAQELINHYEMLKIPKKRGGYRTIYIPPDPLKKIQKRLYRSFFKEMWNLRRLGIYGLYPGTSYIEHVRKHQEAKWVFQFDLSDAFPSVNISMLRQIIEKKLNKELLDFENLTNQALSFLNGDGYHLIQCCDFHAEEMDEHEKTNGSEEMNELWLTPLFGPDSRNFYMKLVEWQKNTGFNLRRNLENIYPNEELFRLETSLSLAFEFMGKKTFKFFPYSLYESLDENYFFRTFSKPIIFSFFPLSLFSRERKECPSFNPFWLLMERKKADDHWTWFLPQREEIAQDITDLIIELTTFQGVLPQGTPTAPFLFYLVLSETDLFRDLQSLCTKAISVYCDNFVISGQKPLSLQLQNELFELLERYGFRINPKKTRNERVEHGNVLVTGLRIRQGKVGLPKKKIRHWRGVIHRAKFDPQLRPKVEGFVASLKPIYDKLPRQIQKPYQAMKAP